MISKTIKFVDYNGVEKERTYWFNMSRADLLDLEMSTEGGWEANLRELIKEQDARKAYKFFEHFINTSYGVRTPDGGFDKDPKYLREFRNSEAYSELIWSFINNPDGTPLYENTVQYAILKKEWNSNHPGFVGMQR